MECSIWKNREISLHQRCGAQTQSLIIADMRDSLRDQAGLFEKIAENMQARLLNEDRKQREGERR